MFPWCWKFFMYWFFCSSVVQSAGNPLASCFILRKLPTYYEILKFVCEILDFLDLFDLISTLDTFVKFWSGKSSPEFASFALVMPVIIIISFHAGLAQAKS